MHAQTPQELLTLKDEIGGREYFRQLGNIDPRIRDQTRRHSAGVTTDLEAIWAPFNGPQTLAYLSDADELFYGGAAGGGKTDLLLGLAATKHLRSVIYRREFAQLSDLMLRSREVLGAVGRFNGSRYLWHSLPGMRTIEFAGLQQEDDKQKWKGRPHDFYGYDELPDITESQFRFTKAWNRTAVVGQRCRVVGAGNPPSTSEGEWVIRYWAPWLESTHTNTAKPGELRWFVMIPDEGDQEVEGPAPVIHRTAGGHAETLTPKSRTFVPALVTDNPAYMATGYVTTLQALPEPLRSQLLYGDFTLSFVDDPWQVIPTQWVRLAQARWRRMGGKPPEGATLDALGVDVARGGADQTCISPRWGNFYGEIEAHPGRTTRDGPAVVRVVLMKWPGPGCAINIDVIGPGSSPFDLLRLLPNVAGDTHAINFAEGSLAHDRSGRLKFANKRAEAYWRFRELLDPELGADIALPPDPELLSDLTSVKWKVGIRGIVCEPKEEIVDRIGRSPDKGDACVLAAFTGYNYAHFHGVDAQVLGSLNDAPPAARMAETYRLTEAEEWARQEQETFDRLSKMDPQTRAHVQGLLNGGF